MEKRWCQRIPVSINAVIQRNGYGLGRVEVKDISLRGMCLKCGPLVFYKNTKLQIKFPDAQLITGNTDTVNAVVVRNTNTDIGLMFAPTEPELINSIIRATEKDIPTLLTPTGVG